MKVLLLTQTEPVIHGQVYMAKQLADGGEKWPDVELITLNTRYSSSREEMRSGGFRKLRLMLGYLKEAVKIVRTENVSVVVLTPAFLQGPFVKDAMMIQVLRWATSAKLVGWIHMDPARLVFSKGFGFLKLLLRRTTGLVDLWVACAPSLADEWPDFIPDRRGVVSNGIPDPAAGQAAVIGEGGRVRVVYLSVMDAAKGWLDLFEAARGICSKNNAVEFHFYGPAKSSQHEQELKNKFAQSDFTDRIFWHGAVSGDDKREALESADLFAFPSHTEQFPVTVLEAMAFGLPIVASDVGAIKDAISEQQLVPAQNPAAMRASIETLLADPDLRGRIGRRNRERYEQNYTKEAFSKQWRKLLASMKT